MAEVSIQRKNRIFEILAVVITACGKFIFMDLLRWKLPFILVAIVFWVGYVFYQQKRNPGIAKQWGFRTDNFSKTVKIVLPFGLAALAVFISLGFYLGTIHITWHIIPILILYPTWGIIQQFLLIALVVGNLQVFGNSKLYHVGVIILAALLFGVLHYPFGWLIVGTFILALFYGFVYLKQRNVYALGIFHGWLGGLFFYTVVNRDPFVEVFGRILHIK
ncbi:MAG: CPBP family glutamic-type intramembrane protease [Janthinobacterium lividum]